MGDKKRKLAEDTPVDEVAPEGKKLKKEKKDKKDKKEKKEKRKADTEVEATPEQPAEAKSEDAKSKEKRERKKEKKEKREEKEKRSAEQADLDDEARAAKKAAKRAKYDKKKVAKEEAVTNGEENGADAGADANTEAEASNETAEAGDEEVRQKNARFICFVGNLPYSANLESLTKHFEKNPPASIRVATKKDAPSKCRGFAFIEFDNYDRMKTCLKLYHHSMFDDGKYPPRRINVELTAGGGGSNSEHRKAKIQAKNEKLNEERQRNAKDTKKDKKKHDKVKPARFGAAASGANAVAVDGAADDDRFAGMHPSRRGRI